MYENRRVLLRRRPNGIPVGDDFEIATGPIPEPGAGQILVRNLYCSLDPAMRRWMDEESYAVPIGIGEVVRCSTVGEVVSSNCEGYVPGDHVVGIGAVENFSLMAGGGFTNRIDPEAGFPLTNYLSLFGAVGMSAYFGLLDVGKPVAGDVVLISGAAGAVGSLVGQIAKIKDCRVVGIAGGPVKCARLIEEFGFDAAVDYKGRDLESLIGAVRRECPEGVNLFFDNVGGLSLDAAMANLAHKARLVMCGMISQYNSVSVPPGPSHIWQIVAKTATMQGFLIRYYTARFAEALPDLMQWAREGRITMREHIDEGLENFQPSFLRLFDGTNDGKLILKIGAAGA